MTFPKDPTNVESKHQKLQSMAIVGHTTDNSCRLWVRMYCEGTWWLVVSEQPLWGDLDTLDGKPVDQFLTDQQITAVYQQAVDIRQATDLTHTFDITGLSAGTRYYYALIADLRHRNDIPRRTEIGNQEKKSFSTLPTAVTDFSFGFYSCHDPFSTAGYSEGAWSLYYDVLKERRALFSIGGGDQVYVDTNDKEDMYSIWEWLSCYKNAIIDHYSDDNGLMKDELIRYFAGIYRKYYRIYWNFINLKKVYESFPQYMIWDDHEIMDGWGSYTRTERRKLLNKWFQDDDEAVNDQLVQLMFVAAKQVYFEYQHSHNPSTPIDLAADQNEHCQWDYHFSVDGSAFYVLDMRGHHDFERRDQGNALLGSLQMQRFITWLNSEAVQQAKAVFIVSPVPVVHWGPLVSSLDVGSLKDDLRDEWEHESNTVERNTLLDAVLSFSHDNKTPLVFLSGDVHCASVYQLEHDERFPMARVFNATSSAISRHPAPEKAEHFMKKTGSISRYDGGKATRLYAKAGEYNLLTVSVDTSEHHARISVDLHWPGGDNREIVSRRIQLV